MTRAITEAQVLDRLRAKIKESGSQMAFAIEHEISAPLVNVVVNGRYHRRGFPPTILAALGVRKVTVYVVAEAETPAVVRRPDTPQWWGEPDHAG